MRQLFRRFAMILIAVLVGMLLTAVGTLGGYLFSAGYFFPESVPLRFLIGGLLFVAGLGAGVSMVWIGIRESRFLQTGADPGRGPRF